MRRGQSIILASGMALASAASVYAQTGAAQQPVAARAPASVSPQRALLDRYCVTCHNQKLKTAGVTFDTIDVANAGADAEVWEKAVRKLRAGLMPPPGRPRPDKPTYDAFASWLEGELDRAAAGHPNPGRTEPFHRLNRAEYQNAVRDLLALEIDVSSLLPVDDASYGFDNIAGVLKVSPTLMERYLLAAQKISRVAIGTPPLFPDVETVRIPADFPQDDRGDGLPFGTRGGTLIRYSFPVDAEYVIQVRLSRRGTSGGEEVDIPRFAESHDLEVSLDGERLQVFTLAGEAPPPEGQRGTQYQQGSRSDLDANWSVRITVRAGPREIKVAFLKKSSAAAETVRLPFLRPYAGAGGDTRYQPYLGAVTITGPFESSGVGNTPSRGRVFVCQPARSADEATCAETILATLARRAYRRPVTEVDLQRLLPFYREGRSERDFDTGIQRALERLLVSPQFLFRVERDPDRVPPNTNYRISDLELASRLSFFLWSSIPDEELLDLAVKGKLGDAVALEQQVRRMLADPRSQALVRNFAGQWLFLRNVPALVPDLDVFPDFDESLRLAFQRETELLIDTVMREDRSALELLDANYTFVNERLARHYGIPTVKGSHFRRVTVTDEERRGLLGHGSILAVTAYPHRTSPVLRGKWVLENLLGTPPPPPPPNVPDLKEKNAAGEVLSMRERMAQHRSSPVCASCHSMMDPAGLSLETFDAVGKRRVVDEAFLPIDASGVLPDGTAFEGVAGLREVLLSRSDRFVTALTEKLLTYALGRGLEYYDAPAVRAITREAARADHRFSSLILGIVKSMPFQMRRSAELIH